jgi:NAD(P)-dependent dehydrogenase (short-subunit alcohol dehydrogenase family)
MAGIGWEQLLEGRVAIVTGAAGGIGGACARSMAEHGASVLVADLPNKGVEAVVDAIAAQGGRAGPFEGDVSDAVDVGRMVDAAVAAWGTVDVLVNAAALTGAALADDLDVVTMSLESWDRNFAVNLRGAMLCCRGVIPVMVDGGTGGSIVNVSSGAAISGSQTLCGYSATKAGVNLLTLHIATAYGKRGVRCNTIMPGLILGTGAMSLDALTDDYLKSCEDNTLTPRLGAPGDIANLATFLASNEVAGYITGQLISCDGGFSAHNPMYADVERMA